MSSVMRNVTWRLVLTVFLGTFGAFTSLAYYATMSNNLLDVAQVFFNTSYDKHYASIYFVGAVAGSMPIGYIAERFGRRNGLLLSSAGVSLVSVVASISPVVGSFELYIGTRVVLGFFCALGAGILPMYLAEITPTDKRGNVGAFPQIMIAIGILCGLAVPSPQILGREKLWPLVLAIPGLINVMELVWLLFCPWSPRHLYLTLNEPEKAKSSVAFFQGEDSVPEYLESLQQEKKAASSENNDESTLSVLGVIKEKSIRGNLIVSIVTIIGMQMDGSAGVFGFSSAVFSAAGMNDFTAEMATDGVGGAVLVSAIISVLIMDLAGRRKIILTGFLLQLFSLIGLQICLWGIAYWGWGQAAKLSSAGVIYLFVGGYSIKSCVVWVAVAELFPQRARSGAMSINMSLNWTLNWATMFVFLPWQNIAHSWSFFPFLISTFLVIVVIFFRLPETAGKEMGSQSVGKAEEHELQKF